MGTSDDQSWEPTRHCIHSLAIELTAFCNQSCDYCYNAWRADGGYAIGSPDTETLVRRISRVLAAVDVEHVTLTGGEPLASHALFPVLDHLRRRSVRAQMISNGALVTPALAARLARYRLMSVLVTLNGPDAATHDAVVGGTGMFERTVEGIEHLRRAKVPVEGSIVVTRRNFDQVEKTLRVFHALGVRKVAVSRFSPAGYSVQHAVALVPSREQIVDALEQAARVARSSEPVRIFSTMPIPPCAVETTRFPEIDFHHCPIGTSRQEFALGPRGEIRHCALHRDPIVPDVLDENFDLATLLGPGDPTHYRSVLPSFCNGCEHASTCGGGCGAAAQWVKGGREHPDPFVKPTERVTHRRSLIVL